MGARRNSPQFKYALFRELTCKGPPEIFVMVSASWRLFCGRGLDSEVPRRSVEGFS